MGKNKFLKRTDGYWTNINPADITKGKKHCCYPESSYARVYFSMASLSDSNGQMLLN